MHNKLYRFKITYAEYPDSYGLEQVIATQYREALVMIASKVGGRQPAVTGIHFLDEQLLNPAYSYIDGLLSERKLIKINENYDVSKERENRAKIHSIENQSTLANTNTTKT